MDAFKGLLASKKFLALLITMIAMLAAHFTPLTEEQVTAFVEHATQLVMAYVIGQGIADHGKEKAKVEAGKG